MKIGIIGAGRLGSALARRLGRCHEVMISNSRGVKGVQAIADDIGCLAGSATDAARFGDVVVVSVPLKSIGDLPADAIGERIVIDTCNYYPNRDGVRPELEDGGETTSGLLQRQLPRARVVKAFNSILSTHLACGGAYVDGGVRPALPIASDDDAATEVVAGLVSDTGLEPVKAGTLGESWRFERARPVYCRSLKADDLRSGLERTGRSDFVPEGSWAAKPA
jgi:8-hydroxy-5-deazaflavin:NADPH oxidoreductase